MICLGWGSIRRWQKRTCHALSHYMTEGNKTTRQAKWKRDALRFLIYNDLFLEFTTGAVARCVSNVFSPFVVWQGFAPMWTDQAAPSMLYVHSCEASQCFLFQKLLPIEIRALNTKILILHCMQVQWLPSIQASGSLSQVFALSLTCDMCDCLVEHCKLYLQSSVYEVRSHDFQTYDQSVWKKCPRKE